MNKEEHAAKTALSIDWRIWLAADNLASEMDVYRSRLYTLALREFLARHEALNVKGRLASRNDILQSAAC